jgi:hypothetical protein
MRWLILLLLLVLVGAAAKNGCYVREYYSIAWSIHDPTERYRKMHDWLVVNEPFCQSSDYVVLWNNMSEWNGNSDHHTLRGLVIDGYKNALKREKK